MKKETRINQGGQAIIIGLVFFAIVILFSGALVKYVSSFIKLERQNVMRAQALQLAEAGIDQAAYQLNHNVDYEGESNTALGNGSFSVSVADIDSDHKRVTSTGVVSFHGQTATRTIKATLAISDTVVSFRYGVQAGNGGFTMDNSSTITGNVFSSGPIIGSSENYIYGDAVSAGPDGSIYGIHATGSVFSHSVGTSGGKSTKVDKDAYYVNITNTTVSGISHPDSPDQSPAPFPIPDSLISQWEGDAEAGGTISECDADGDYTIEGQVSLGPKKITCNLIIKDADGVLNVTGPIWITGDIDVKIGSTIRMDDELEDKNVAIIADNPSDTTDSGIISVNQGSIFEGSGEPGSFVIMISQNNSAETGGSTVAISQNQGAAALVAYASHGLATMSQSANVKEVTAYKIALSQSANVTYDSGLPSTLFESGPGASWLYVPGSYVIER